MNSTSTIVLFLIIIIPAVIVVLLILRVNRNQYKMLSDKQARGSEFESGPRNAAEAEATVISKAETISPKAGNIARVDLVLEVHQDGKAPYQASVRWLVEIDSLDLVAVGKSLPVKIDLAKPERVFPNAPWARMWVFG